MPAETYQSVLSEAVAHFAEHGFISAEDFAYWAQRLRRAAEASLIPQDELVRQLRETLGATYRRLVDQGQILSLHPGISRFTYERIKPHLRAELDRRIFAAADLIRLNRAKAVEDTVQRLSGWISSVPAGGTEDSRREKKAEIRKPLASLPFIERRVIIDQTHKMTSAISELLAVDGGALAGEWTAVHRPGYQNRPQHLARDPHAGHRNGKVYVVRGNWALEAGLMVAPDGYVDEIERPGQLPFCFPGETRVPFADGVRKAYRHWYAGDLTEIVTRDGETLRATPNHPVLTPHGWIAIGSLDEGDYVIKAADQRFGVLGKSHQDDAVPSIAEVFATLDEFGVTSRVAGSPQQFHGDGSDSDVDTVSLAWPLRFGRQPATQKSIEQLGLAMTAIGRASAGAPDEFLMRGLLTASRLMRSMDELLAIFASGMAITQSAGVTPAAYVDSSPFEAYCERLARGTESAGQGEKTFPFDVAPTQIVHIERRAWAGHVYNLETEDGWFVAEGVISHNCSCRYRWKYGLANLPEAMLTARGRVALADARAQAQLTG